MLLVLSLYFVASCLASPACIRGDLFIQLPTMDLSRETTILQLGSTATEGLGRWWRKRRREAVAERLREHAKRSQSKIIGDLEEAGLTYKSYWINNSIWVRDPPCSFQLFLLAAETGGLELVPDRIVARIPKPILAKSPAFMERLVLAGIKTSSAPAWNLEMIRVGEAWKRSRGAGVTVATIDTGVSHRHPSLSSSFRGGPHSWFDPKGASPEPSDEVGHGTHTMGTILGEAIGVAPGAKWISAKGCTAKGCSQHDLLASAQWIMCPTDGVGGEERCDLGADLVSNSWGSSGGTGEEAGMLDWFKPAVEAWRAAGIIPIFAIGNEGPKCGSAGAPGTFSSVLGVGSVGPSFGLSKFSSHGPGPSSPPYSASKPDLVAPGESILSASHTTDGHVNMSGTSMAAPHVAGTVALLLSLKPDLDFDRIKAILVDSCQRSCLKAPVDGLPTCGQISWDQFPESLHYGAGLLDAATAFSRIP